MPERRRAMPETRLQALASELKFKDIRVFLAVGTRRPSVYNVGRYFSASRGETPKTISGE
jgi:hypothetical protein